MWLSPAGSPIEANAVLSGSAGVPVGSGVPSTPVPIGISVDSLGDRAARRIRWSSQADLLLLQETASVMPYDKPRVLISQAWEDIASLVKMHNPGMNGIKGRTCRERVNTLLQLWRDADLKGLKSSGRTCAIYSN